MAISRFCPNALLNTLFSGLIALMIFSCETDTVDSHWTGSDELTIYQYLEKNQSDYSKFYRILEKGRLLGTLSAYNPYGENYTLFLPTNDAIDRFIEKSEKYHSIEEVLKDTSFLYSFTRYHVLNRKVHTDEFPDGALMDKTLTGDRLITGFYTDGENQVIKVNNVAPIIKSNINLTNGYIHVITEVLQKAEIKGYDWIQQNGEYSILAGAMELALIPKRLWFSKYTIFAENDSIYHREGIFSVQDLIDRIATPGLPLANDANDFYQFTAFHIIRNEYYLTIFNGEAVITEPWEASRLKFRLA